ncbi:MAG: hypothetical protein QOI16_2295, partial [Pseudonocardiales bacterium]|nr:hypothetical protein [Pseudonocardiales bacterium]
PPCAAALAGLLGRGTLVRIPGLGHVIGQATADPLVETIVELTMSIPTSA